MTGAQLVNLKIGDECVIIRGKDKGRECCVVYVEGEAVLVRSTDGRRFSPLTQYGRLKLTSYRELKPLPAKET